MRNEFSINFIRQKGPNCASYSITNLLNYLYKLHGRYLVFDPDAMVDLLRSGLNDYENGIDTKSALKYLKEIKLIKNFMELEVGEVIKGVGKETYKDTVLRVLENSPEPVLMKIRTDKNYQDVDTRKGEYREPTNLKASHLVVAFALVRDKGILIQDPNYEEYALLPNDQIEKRVVDIYRVVIKSQDELEWDRKWNVNK